MTGFSITGNTYITGADIINCFMNTSACVGCAAAGFGIAFIVDELAHKIFSIQHNTRASSLVKFGSMLAGIAVSMTLASHTALVVFTTEKVFEMALFCLIPQVAIYVLTKRRVTFALAEGAAIGYLGPYSMIPFGVAGSFLGVAIEI